MHNIGRQMLNSWLLINTFALIEIMKKLTHLFSYSYVSN